MQTGLLLLLGVATILIGRPALATVTIDWVTVGDPGNPPDTGLAPAGAVGYEFNIGRHEVTIGQYAAFLNATARSDPNSLYNPGMGSNAWVAGIARAGTSGSYTYSTIGSPDRPISFVGWFDAARFANWMHNGQPADGSGTETGAYNLNGELTGIFIREEATARYWIPSDDEWYKAAFYDPTKGGAGGYWLYPTRSDTAPGNELDGSTNQANLLAGDYATTPGNGSLSMSLNYLTEVGSFAGSPSYYGTFDQGGNVWEWNDYIYERLSYRGTRGGGWASEEDGMRSTYVHVYYPWLETSDIGFRLAAIPEPAAITLLLAAGFGMIGRRRVR